MILMLLLIGLLILAFLFGWIIASHLFSTITDALFIAAAASIFGPLVTFWFMYVLATVTHSLQLSICTTELLLTFVCVGAYATKHLSFRRYSITVLEALVCIVCVVISSWLMIKTLRSGANSNLLIGSNEVLDMGHNLAIIRSMAWGSNIPYLSPTVAGTVDIYHFMFYFWCAVFEYLSLPLVWALNVPSIIAFSSFLVVLYFLPRYLFGKNIWYSIVTISLALTHSTLTFFYFLFDKRRTGNIFSTFWHMPKYFFAAPYDGSAISIYWTLNVFVNQRHLIFGITAVILLYFAASSVTKRGRNVLAYIVTLGVLLGLLIWWHTTLWMAGIMLITLWFAITKRLKCAFIFGFVSSCVGLLHAISWIIQLRGVHTIATVHASPIFYWFFSKNFVDLLGYWWMNSGILIGVVAIGIYLLPKNKRMFFLPFAFLFLTANCVRLTNSIDENHKMINLIFILADMVAAYGLVTLWKKNTLVKSFCVICFILLTASGIMDLMVIKNDFMYPVQDAPGNSLMNFIQTKTSKTAIFISPPDIFDPVTLAGRREFNGFFNGNLYPDRQVAMKNMYEMRSQTESHLFADHSIDYLVAPLTRKPDFHYSIDLPFFTQTFPLVFADSSYKVFAVR